MPKQRRRRARTRYLRNPPDYGSEKLLRMKAAMLGIEMTGKITRSLVNNLARASSALDLLLHHKAIDDDQHQAGWKYAQAHKSVFGRIHPKVHVVERADGKGRTADERPSDVFHERLRRQLSAELDDTETRAVENVIVYNRTPRWVYSIILAKVRERPSDRRVRSAFLSGIRKITDAIPRTVDLVGV
jgi:hypothetical protein